MRLLRLSLTGLALGLLAACGTSAGLDLSVTPLTIAGDGAAPITVLAKVTKGGTPVEGGTVHLTLDVGRFKDAAGDGKALDSTDGTATILAPRIGHGFLTLTATASVEGTALKQTAKVALTPAGGLANSLSFTCSRNNVGAFVKGRTEPIHVLCTAQAFDANKKQIPSASIETMAEAGHLDWHTDDASGKQYLIYTVEVGDAPPKDVDPFGPDGNPRSCTTACIADPSACDAEPCWLEGNTTHNPRDGLATLVVAVPGAKSINDTGEPFVDAADSGKREASAAYIDYNGNEKYDPPDGTTTERMLWKQVHIVWSGDVDVSISPHTSKITASVSGKTAAVTARLTDKNYNTLAASGGSGTDVITFTGTCTPGGNLTLTPSSKALDQTKAGIKLVSDPLLGEVLDGPRLPTSYRDGSDYTISATIDPGGNTCPVDAMITRQYDPGAPPLFTGSSSTSENGPTGSINFPP